MSCRVVPRRDCDCDCGRGKRRVALGWVAGRGGSRQSPFHESRPRSRAYTFTPTPTRTDTASRAFGRRRADGRFDFTFPFSIFHFQYSHRRRREQKAKAKFSNFAKTFFTFERKKNYSKFCNRKNFANAPPRLFVLLFVREKIIRDNSFLTYGDAIRSVSVLLRIFSFLLNKFASAYIGGVRSCRGVFLSFFFLFLLYYQISR